MNKYFFSFLLLIFSINLSFAQKKVDKNECEHLQFHDKLDFWTSELEFDFDYMSRVYRNSVILTTKFESGNINNVVFSTNGFSNYQIVEIDYLDKLFTIMIFAHNDLEYFHKDLRKNLDNHFKIFNKKKDANKKP